MKTNSMQIVMMMKKEKSMKTRSKKKINKMEITVT
jgi:hypothetical protein